MPGVLRQQTIIRPGGWIEIQSSELPEGVIAEVIVLWEPRKPQAVPLRHLIGTAKGCYATPDEADAFIRRERDAWDS